MNATKWIVFFLVVAGLFIGIFTLKELEESRLPQSKGSTNTYGNQKSKVTLVEYVDFQCEACYAYYPTVKMLKEKYQDKVKFQVRHFPISTSHQYARIAAGYAEAAAKQDKFWEMHDKIFEGQKTWEQTSNPEKIFDKYASELNLDLSTLESDRSSDNVKAAINADIKSARDIKAEGTPTFVINGKRVNKIENSLEAFSKLLDQELSRTGNEGE